MSGLQILAFLSGLAGLGATIGAMVSNEWRATSRASSVITATWVLQGLWNNCAGNAIGALHCRPHHTILNLEGKLRESRRNPLVSQCSHTIAWCICLLSSFMNGMWTYGKGLQNMKVLRWQKQVYHLSFKSIYDLSRTMKLLPRYFQKFKQSRENLIHNLHRYSNNIGQATTFARSFI